jgi:hypothetical protein
MRNFSRLFKQRGSQGGTSAMRGTFTYVGSAVQLVSMDRLEMVPPPSDPTPAQLRLTGFWYELRDAQGRTLYRRVIQNPMQAAEVRTDDPRRPLARQAISQPRGSFILLMPDLPEGESLVLFSSPLEPEAIAAPAQEIARFDLRQPPPGKEQAT